MASRLAFLLGAAMVLMLGGGPAVAGRSLDRSDALAALEQFDPGQGEARLHELLADLEQSLITLDDQTWQRALAVVDSPRRPWQVRVGVFNVVARKVNTQEQAMSVVSRATTWMEVAANAEQQKQPHVAPEGRAEGSFLITFVDLISRDPWRSWVARDRRTVDLLVRLASGEAGIELAGAGGLATPVDALVGLPAPPDMLSEAAFRVLIAETRGSSADLRLCVLLNQAAIARLRDTVAASGADPLSLHLGAAGALANLGDREIVPLLERLRAQYATAGPSLYEGREVSAGPRIAQVIDSMLQKIEAQHPPETLLTLVNPDGPWTANESGRRAWALARALQLGVPAERLREALLARAGALREQFSDPTSRKADLLLNLSLRELKAAGVHHGVLTDADLPEVPMPEGH